MTALRNMSFLLRALHSSASPALRNADPRVPRSLFETLSRLPKDGVSSRVFQTRWQSKGIEGCYWEITRVKMKNGGKNGRAWGKLVWRGKNSIQLIFALFRQVDRLPDLPHFFLVL